MTPTPIGWVGLTRPCIRLAGVGVTSPEHRAHYPCHRREGTGDNATAAEHETQRADVGAGQQTGTQEAGLVSHASMQGREVPG